MLHTNLYTMPAEAFAAISAVLFAGSHVVSKRGMRTTDVVGGLLVSLSTGLTVLTIVVLLDPPSNAPWELLLLVAASGMLAPALARAAAIAGVDRLGPTVSVPIQSSVYPLFAVFGASLVLGEPAGLARWIGVGAIVLGVWFLALRGADISPEDGLTPRPERGRMRSWLAGGLLFPVIAGLGYGGADLIRKNVIVDLPHPAFMSLVAVAAALTAWCTATVASTTVRGSLRFGRSTYWFMLGGALSSLALLSQFRALETGDVSTVSPIVASQPLAVLLLSSIFLRGIERLDWSIAFGGISIVTGTILVSI